MQSLISEQLPHKIKYDGVGKDLFCVFVIYFSKI